MMTLKLSLIVLISLAIQVHTLEWYYHSNSQLENFMKSFSDRKHGEMKANLYSIGTSKKGNNLWVMELTAAKPGKIGVPNIKFVGTVHGNEPVGRELLLRFMEHLRDNYGLDPIITSLLDNTRIHILPNYNPDGFALARENNCSSTKGRTNGSPGVDLTRNFPDQYHGNYVAEAPETRAMKKWLNDIPFILSATLHGGALVVTYPFNSVKDKPFHVIQKSLSPDDDVFVHLAKVYSQNHLTLSKGASCGYSVFQGGITNGAEWFPMIGSMQDYNYVSHGCMELSLEVSCCNYPPASELSKFWEENKTALLKYCFEALKGVAGQIIDRNTRKPIPHASLKISGRNINFFSSKTGEFWRILIPGKYNLEVKAEGYHDQVLPFVVEDYEESLPKLTILNVCMTDLLNGTSRYKAAERETEGSRHQFKWRLENKIHKCE